MKAAETNLRGLLEGGKQYSIPMFQRPYSWKDKEWETLWEDVITLYGQDESEEMQGTNHFLGPIVTVAQYATANGISPYLVIDGQQRLVTLSVLLASIRDYMKANNYPENVVNELHNLYVINQYKEGNSQFKIIPTKTDREVYEQIALAKIPKELTGNSVLLLQAYTFFSHKLSEIGHDEEPPLDLTKLKRILLESVYVVHITLDAKDNPYIIFESLNNKGTALTQADLVRNFFFMNLPLDKHDEIYLDTWYPTQTRFKDYAGNDYSDELTNAFWYYLRKSGSKATSKQVYQGIKQKLERPGVNIETSLHEMLQFADYYRHFCYPESEPDHCLRNWFSRFKRLDFTTSYPLLLNLYDQYDKKRLSLAEFDSMLHVVESYFIRRLFVGRPTNALNKVFNNLYLHIEGDLSRDALARTLISYSGNREWPNDERFREGIIKLLIYNKSQADRIKLVLESLEGALTKEKINPDNLTVEHIMPQTLTEDWRYAMGPDAEEQHMIWCHTLGNLTLTGYNSELSNRSFAEKKLYLCEKSNINLNKYFCDVELWDIKAIKKRGEYLADLAIKVWAR